MSVKQKILSFLMPGTFGLMAIADFLICVLSGVFLSIPYNPLHAFQSISEILLYNPAASFIRNIHYWSAQLFLIFTLLHIFDHFKQKNEKKLKFPIWFRLSLSILIVFYVVLSGFILKGDNDSLQAQRILSNILLSIPLIGKEISFLLTGNDGSLSVIYLHHIATATIILIFSIFEHSRIIWGKKETFVSAFLVVIILSLIFTAPLHDGFNPVVKGPWYFVGLQEILHNFSNPLWAVFIIILVTIIVAILPKMNQYFSAIFRKTLFLFVGLFIILTIIAFYFRGENWRWIFPWQKNYFNEIYFPSWSPVNPFKTVVKPQSVSILNESCLYCHNKMKGFSPSHNPEIIGCVSCHSGNPFSLLKRVAHRKMINQPGNLETATLSCGTSKCHPEISSRIQKNIMTTMSGIISINRFAMNEQSSPSVLSHISEIKNSKTDIHLKNLCTQCHLGKSKNTYGPHSQLSTGGGCLACHLKYSAENTKELKVYFGKKSIKKGHLTKQHPELNLKTGNEACFACHSRSGRISLSYEGWYETLLAPHQVKGNKQYKILDDQRVLSFEGADIHHQAGMQCIDCHNSYELMGDGKLHIHKEDQIQLSCSDCHQKPPFKTISKSNIDKESALIVSLRGFKQDHFLITAKSGIPVINSYTNNTKDSAFLIGKNNGKTHIIKTPSIVCSNNSHKDLSCEMCHTPRVAACIGCHNSFNPKENGINNLKRGKTKGNWTEFAGEFTTAAPTAGVSTKNGKRKIVPMMPGMIMSVSEVKSNDSFFKRLYAPANPHNTVKPKDNCKECHFNPITLGYGKGSFVIKKSNHNLNIRFEPFYAANKWDFLAEDAWIDFLKEAIPPYTTRSYIRPFNINEQKRLLTVASCLYCHDEKSIVIKRCLDNFDLQLKKRTSKCLSPSFKINGF